MKKNLDIEKIKYLYLSKNLSINEIAKELDVRNVTISDRLKKAGVQIINRQNISKIDKETEKLVIDLYTNNKISVTEITKIINESRNDKISFSVIYKCLHKNNIRVINYQNRPKFDQKIFDVIDTEEKAYWLGFIYADGYISSRDNSFEISLKLGDILHLEKFNKFMKHEKYNIKIREIKLNNKTFYSCRWYITNKHLWNTLNTFGCTPRKSSILRFPNENIFKYKHLIRHFIRGYFDGDGCLSYYRDDKKGCIPKPTILGTEKFLLSLKEILYRNNIECKLSEDRRNNIWILCFLKKIVMYF